MLAAIDTEAVVRNTARLIALASENPPGRNYEAAASLLAEILEEANLAPETIAGPASVAGESRNSLRAFFGSGPTLYFHGHYDVVPAQSPAQFTPRVADGVIWGRGSADMKGGLAAMIAAASAVKAAAGGLRGRLGLVFVPDEETGGEGGSAYLRRRGLLATDAIGMLSAEPTGGVVWNACRGAVSLRVTVRGRAAHVGLSHEGDNAFLRMHDVVTRLRGLADEISVRKTSYAITPAAAAQSILLLGGEVSGGNSFNIVPDHCLFSIDRRFNPEEDRGVETSRIVDLLEELRVAGYDLAYEVVQEGDAAGTPADAELGDALARAVTEIEGTAPSFELCPGLLEIRFYPGVPAYCYGPGSLELAHGPDESVDVAALERCAAVYALTAVEMLT